MKYWLSVVMTLLVVLFAVPEAGAAPVGYWKMDGDLTDSVANNDGTYICTHDGTPHTAAFGAGATSKTGQALDLSAANSGGGTKDRVEVPYPDAIRNNARLTLSISAWIKPDAKDFAFTVFSGPHHTFYLARGPRGNLVWNMLIWDYGWVSIGGYPMTTDWQHVAVTWGSDGTVGTARLYINGKLYDEDTWTQADVGGQSVRIRPHSSGPMTIAGGFLSGRIDEVRIYNNTLTADEVATQYSEAGGSLEQVVDNAKAIADNEDAIDLEVVDDPETPEIEEDPD